MRDTSITALFQDAHDDGTIGGDSLNLLATEDLNGQLQHAMGISVDEVTAAEVTLVTMEVDDSVSMEPMAQDAREAQHLMVDALAGSKQSEGVLMATWTFEMAPVHGYQPLTNVSRLDDQSYKPWRGNTPLFDSTIRVLGGVLAKTQEFAGNGVPVRSVTVIVTDGANNASRHTARDVATVVSDLERSEMHLVLFIGIDDGGYTDFRGVAKSMGIRDDRVMTIGNSPSELRRAVQVASQSALQVSQATGTVSQVGFGAVS